MQTQLQQRSAGPCELRFESLFQRGRGFAFPCDAAGRVDLAAMSPHAKSNYQFAMRSVGREFGVPVVRCEGRS